MPETKIAILCSGGIDSTVLIHEAVKEEKIRPQLIIIGYEEAAFQTQYEKLKRTANILDLSIEILNLKYFDWQKKKGLFTPNYIPEEKDPLKNWNELRYENFFIEGRNLIMLAYSIAYCSAHQIDELRVGYIYSPEEWRNRRSYKLITGDNSPHFVDMINLLTLTGFSHQIRVRAPFYERRWGKDDTIKKAIHLNIDIERDTYSCYFVPACQKCDNCLLRKNSLRKNKKEEI